MTPPPGCVAEDVTVSEGGTGLTLLMIDAYGRVTRRTVSDVRAAAAVIESRTGVDLLVPLLPGAEAVSDERDAADDGKDDGKNDGKAEGKNDGRDGKDGRELLVQAAPRGPAPEAVAQAAPVSEAHPATHGVTLLVATEMAAGSDDSGWAGLSLSGCVTLGPICLGTLLRFWHDLDASDESANVLHKRDSGEVAVSLDLPFSRGRFAFRPGVELGVGWIHMGGFGAHAQMLDDNEFDHGDVSAGLHLAASLPLSRRWSIEGGLGVSVALFAHQAPFFVNGVTLPGEPLAYGLATLGFRYGVPRTTARTMGRGESWSRCVASMGFPPRCRTRLSWPPARSATAQRSARSTIGSRLTCGDSSLAWRAASSRSWRISFRRRSSRFTPPRRPSRERPWFAPGSSPSRPT